MMDLFKYHSSPGTLDGYEYRNMCIPLLAYEYAKFVIKGRFLEGEAAILDDANYALAYVCDILGHKRWPEFEERYVSNSGVALQYAKDVIKGRWPEAEPYMLKTYFWGIRYAMEVMMERWPELEADMKRREYPEILVMRYKDVFGITGRI